MILQQAEPGAPWWLWTVCLLVGVPPLALTAYGAALAVHDVFYGWHDLIVCDEPQFLDYLLIFLPGGVLFLIVAVAAAIAQRSNLNWLKPVALSCSCLAVSQCIWLAATLGNFAQSREDCRYLNGVKNDSSTEVGTTDVKPPQ